MAKKMEAGQTQTLKKVLHYMKPYRFFPSFIRDFSGDYCRIHAVSSTVNR